MKVSRHEHSENILFTTIHVNEKLQLTFCNLGAALYEVIFSDRFNKKENVTLIPHSKDHWLRERTFAGAIVGPLAGRYQVKDEALERNRPPIHFHGGSSGLDTLVWQQELVEKGEQTELLFHCRDPHTNLPIQVKYTLTKQQELLMEISGQPVQPVFFNPTNHVYWNLNGDPFEPVTNHRLTLPASSYFEESPQQLLLHKAVIPPQHWLDFSHGKSLQQLAAFGGLDTTFLLEGAARTCLLQPENGRQLTITTTLPAAVIFTFNQEQPLFQRYGRPYPKFAGITFETQYPANQLAEVSFTKSKPYYSQTRFAFSIND